MDLNASGPLKVNFFKKGEVKFILKLPEPLNIHSYVNPCSEKMGVHERYSHTRLRNTDNFVGQPHLVRALEEGLKSVAPSAKMTKHADLVLKPLFCTNSCTLLKMIKSGAPSAKMTKRADLGLKRLFCTNSCTLLKVAKK